MSPLFCQWAIGTGSYHGAALSLPTAILRTSHLKREPIAYKLSKHPVAAMGQRNRAGQPAPGPAVVHKHGGRPVGCLLLLALPGGLHERLVRPQPLLDRPLRERKGSNGSVLHSERD